MKEMEQNIKSEWFGCKTKQFHKMSIFCQGFMLQSDVKLQNGSSSPPISGKEVLNSLLVCGLTWLVCINPTNGKGISSFLDLELVWFELKSGKVEES